MRRHNGRHFFDKVNSLKLMSDAFFNVYCPLTLLKTSPRFQFKEIKMKIIDAKCLDCIKKYRERFENVKILVA